MKANALLVAALLVCATLLFVPHHRRAPDSFTPNTLGGIYWKLFSQLPDRWNAERATFLAIILAGVFASLAPIVVALMLRWHRPPVDSAGGWAFGIVAVLAAIGSAANGFLILLNHTSFAFGGSPVPRDAVAFAWGASTVQLLFALAALAIAASARAAMWAR